MIPDTPVIHDPVGTRLDGFRWSPVDVHRAVSLAQSVLHRSDFDRVALRLGLVAEVR